MPVLRSAPVTEPSAAYALSLLRLRGIGRRTVVALLGRFGDEAALRGASEADLLSVAGKRAAQPLLDGLASDWDRAREWADIEVARHEKAGVKVVPFGSATYPPLLAVSPDPPALLYVLGSVDALSALLTVAVVGTRQPTMRGREIARRVARRFAETGAVVVSGLAAGIDTAGHEGALETGRTVAVLGTAIDVVYPAENRTLARRIEQAGALVSEYPMGYVSRSSAFAERDRIQAGLSLAVVCVRDQWRPSFTNPRTRASSRSSTAVRQPRLRRTTSPACWMSCRDFVRSCCRPIRSQSRRPVLRPHSQHRFPPAEKGSSRPARDRRHGSCRI
jgi:DNA processing protein